MTKHLRKHEKGRGIFLNWSSKRAVGWRRAEFGGGRLLFFAKQRLRFGVLIYRLPPLPPSSSIRGFEA